MAWIRCGKCGTHFDDERFRVCVICGAEGRSPASLARKLSPPGEARLVDRPAALPLTPAPSSFDPVDEEPVVDREVRRDGTWMTWLMGIGMALLLLSPTKSDPSTPPLIVYLRALAYVVVGLGLVMAVKPTSKSAQAARGDRGSASGPTPEANAPARGHTGSASNLWDPSAWRSAAKIILIVGASLVFSMGAFFLLVFVACVTISKKW